MRSKLTLRMVQATKVKRKPYEVRDTEIKGLLLRVQPSGVKTFYAQWGRGKRTAIGKFPVTTVDAARARAKSILAQAANGGTPASVKSRAKAPTWGVFLDTQYAPWVRAERKAGNATVGNLRAQFSGFENKPLEEITALRVEKFKADRLNAGVSPVTVNRDLDRLRAALNKAVEWGTLKANPIASVKRSRVNNEQRVRFLDEGKEKRLRAALAAREVRRRNARQSGNAHAHARRRQGLPVWSEDQFTDHLMPLVLLAMNTGLRRGELLQLTWEAVDLKAKWLRVAATTEKNANVRFMPLNSEAHAILTSLGKYAPTKSGPVFPGRKGAVMTNIARSWRRICADTGLSDFHFHDLRHHFASQLVMAGVDLYAVKELLGHSSLEMTQRYAHLSQEHQAAAVQKLVDHQ